MDEAELNRDNALARGDKVAADEWQLVMNILEEMGEDGMSSDESEPGPGNATIYRSRRPSWRSEALERMLLDKLGRLVKTNAYGGKTPGNKSRTRVRGSAESRRKARPGLPRNFYSDKFYDSLNAKQRRQLNTSPNFVEL